MDNKSIVRLWEIDFLRGIAIIMMIIFHFLYDTNYFGIYRVNLQESYLLFFNYSIGTIFLLLVGVSLTLSYSRIENILTKKDLRLKFFKRGLKIFCMGLIITIITWYFIGGRFVAFGVLHCIGISIILAYPFLRFRFFNFLVGGFLIILGLILRNLTLNFYWLFWLGLKYPDLHSIDFFPILPWFGVVLIGIFVGNSLYPKYRRAFSLKDLSGSIFVRFFCFLGRHSLLIYFLHHIVLLSIVYIILAL